MKWKREKKNLTKRINNTGNPMIASFFFFKKIQKKIEEKR